MFWPDDVDALNEIKVVRGVRGVQGVQGEKPGGRVGEGRAGETAIYALRASKGGRGLLAASPFRRLAHSPTRQSTLTNHFSLPLLRPPPSLCRLRGQILRRRGIALIKLLQHQASRASGPDFVPPMANHENEIISDLLAHHSPNRPPHTLSLTLP